MVLDVGVHDGSEVVEPAVPEQVNDEHLRAETKTSFLCWHLTGIFDCKSPYQWLENQRPIFISVVVQKAEKRIQDISQELREQKETT